MSDPVVASSLVTCRSGMLYNPVDTSALPIPDLSPSVTKVMWDIVDWSVFVACDAQEISTFAYVKCSALIGRGEICSALIGRDC